MIIVLLSESSRSYLGGMGAGLDFVIYGFLIMLIAVYQPDGIMGAVHAYRKKKRRLALLKEQEAATAAKPEVSE